MLEPYTEYYDSDFVYVEAQKSYIIVLHDNSCYIQYFFLCCSIYAEHNNNQQTNIGKI